MTALRVKLSADGNASAVWSLVLPYSRSDVFGASLSCTWLIAALDYISVPAGV